jgi:5-formyltetrahydrofolate cyclo-ligase
VTAVGLAWGVGECRFGVEPHDQALSIIVTERELLAP